MGYGEWSNAAYANYSRTASNMTLQEVFQSRRINSDLDPKSVQVREARDSETNPESTPLIIGLDVTGSMGHIAYHIAHTGLGKLVSEILERRPITDPAIMFVGIGDADSDRAPLQVGQFESDIVMTRWLEMLYLEGGGGGNGKESYDLAYHFALHHTATDSFEKRNNPGVIVTIGDDGPSEFVKKDHVNRFLFGGAEIDTEFSSVIESVRPMFTPYHINISQGGTFSKAVTTKWANLLGNASITLYDYRKIAELIVTMLDVDSGTSVADAISTWPEDTQEILMRSFEPLVESGSRRLSRRIDH